jgi:hypothetical protein
VQYVTALTEIEKNIKFNQIILKGIRVCYLLPAEGKSTQSRSDVSLPGDIHLT